jgi:hypothetical protein
LLGLVSLNYTPFLNTDNCAVLEVRRDFEGPQLDVGLDGLVRELATDETFGVENSVYRISGSLVLGCVTDEALVVSEGDVRGGCVETLVICNNFNAVILPDTNARIRSSEINTDG